MASSVTHLCTVYIAASMADKKEHFGTFKKEITETSQCRTFKVKDCEIIKH